MGGVALGQEECGTGRKYSCIDLMVAIETVGPELQTVQACPVQLVIISVEHSLP